MVISSATSRPASFQFIMNIYQLLRDRIQGKAPKGARRSSKWSKVRKAHLKENPECAVCGKTENTVPHHILPFYLFPDQELNPDNLITLCEKKSHHIQFGHLMYYKSFNLSVKSDAVMWREKIKNRP